MKNILVYLVIPVLIFFSTSCSVYMAATQPGEKDVSVLNQGTPRGEVITELGSPTAYRKPSRG